MMSSCAEVDNYFRIDEIGQTRSPIVCVNSNKKRRSDLPAYRLRRSAIKAKKSKRRQNVISVTSKLCAAVTETNPTKKQRLRPFVRHRSGRGKTSIVALLLALPL
jgi:hypothetical protein